MKIAAPFEIRPAADFCDRHPHLMNLARQLGVYFAHGEIRDEAPLKQMGAALWQALDVAEAFASARRARPNHILPLVLVSADPGVLFLPWECLHHPEHGFLAKQPGFSLTRRHETDAADEDPPPVGPLRVLLFHSLPDTVNPESGRLNVETEEWAILEALNPLVRQGRARVTVADDGTWPTFHDLVQREDFHLVFLSGHGSFRDNKLVDDREPESFFLFEADDGGEHQVEAAELVGAFAGTDVRCVVLSACQTGKQASDSLNAGLTLRLVQQGIPHVIGMRESVLDSSARQFARAFFDGLARTRRVATLVQKGRAAMTQALAGQGVFRQATGAGVLASQWCLPVLYSRDVGADLVDWDFVPVPPSRQVETGDVAGLPVPDRFIGRRRELLELGRMIHQKCVRRLLITGPGGQGKTSLAGKLAVRLAQKGWQVQAFSARPGASWSNFVQQIKATLPPQAAERIDLTWNTLPSEAERVALVLAALNRQAEDKQVVILDNLETLQDAGTRVLKPEVMAWLEAARQLGAGAPLLLLTSRWDIPAFGGAGEHHHRLQAPRYGDFLRYCQEFPEVALDRKDLLTLYQNIGGNFKGLDFYRAAVKLNVDRAAFLTHVADARQEMVAFMGLEAVYGGLHEDEQRLLQRFRVFKVPVFEEAAALVGRELAQPRACLQRLAGYGLFEVPLLAPQGVPRYRLVPVVEDWLDGQAPPPDLELRQAAARYLQHVMWHTLFTLEMVLATHQALVAAEMKHEAGHVVLNIITASYRRWGMVRELVEVWLPPLLEIEDLSIRQSTIENLGEISIRLGRYQAAQKWLEEAYSIQEKKSDFEGMACTCNNLASIFKIKGDLSQAIRYYDEALRFSNEINDRKGKASILNNLSQIFSTRGEYSTALSYLKRSLKIRKNIKDRQGEGHTLSNIGKIFLAQGSYQKAKKKFSESLTIAQKIDDREGEGAAYDCLAHIYQSQGNDFKALDLYKQSLSIRREIDDKSGEATTLNNISTIYSNLNDDNLAINYLHQCLGIVKNICDKTGEAVAYNNLSQIYKKRCDFDNALKYLHLSLDICREIHDRSGESTVLHNLSQIMEDLGKSQAALDFLHQSLKIKEEINNRPGLCATLFKMGHIHWQNEEQEEAFSAWLTVYQIAKTIGEHQALQALANLAQSLGGDGLDFWEELLARAEKPPEQNGT